MDDEALILVHGLCASGAARKVRARRARAVADFGQKFGVRSYECVVSGERVVANYMVQRMRGTAPAPAAVELFELDSKAFREALGTPAGQADFQNMASCESYGIDPADCFTLVGKPRKLHVGLGAGQRVLWFGRGLPQLSDAEFAAHYSLKHGPLVSSYASLIGLRRYTQVLGEEHGLAATCKALGMGRADPPVVFAELVMGPPALSLGKLSEYRRAAEAIKADEQRHVDFSRSMLLLA